MAQRTGEGRQRHKEGLSHFLELCKDKCSLFIFSLSETKVSSEGRKPGEQTAIPHVESEGALQWSEPFLGTVVWGEGVCVDFELHSFIQILTWAR